jgi:HPt (histidine-containing phosphotransfer) domain-containing protein
MVQDPDATSQHGSDASGEIIDLSVMDQLLSLDDGELGLLEEMLSLYKEDTPGRIVAIEHTLNSGDMTDMADVAHAIKGAASTMGAPKVRGIAAELEGAGRSGKHLTDPQILLAALKEAYQESIDAMDAFVAGRKG